MPVVTIVAMSRLNGNSREELPVNMRAAELAENMFAATDSCQRRNNANYAMREKRVKRATNARNAIDDRRIALPSSFLQPAVSR